LRRMHKLGDEKRSLVIVPPEDYDAWLLGWGAGILSWLEPT